LKRRNVNQIHKHTTVTTRAIRQRSGIPYEVERKICKDCSRLLEERPVKRASAA
jgi:RNase P subunit RPR2